MEHSKLSERVAKESPRWRLLIVIYIFNWILETIYLSVIHMVLTCASGTKHYYDAPSSSQQICSLPSSSATWVQAPSFALAYLLTIDSTLLLPSPFQHWLSKWSKKCLCCPRQAGNTSLSCTAGPGFGKLTIGDICLRWCPWRRGLAVALSDN